ncbi:MAG TPA: sigma-70 family RNA polymerase sigma factor [Rectinemataceae bacterium]|nr:sigma-70 family RNA polymerase sigma factor [Rectinemataceae bacterium]
MTQKDEREDLALLRRIADSESGALRALYQKYGSLVYGIALRVTGDGAVAEEVAQDVFMNAWRSASTYRPELGAVATWLGRIARNRAVDALRSQRARGSLARDDWTEAAEQEDPRSRGPEEETARSIRAGEVREAVAALPEPQRQALSLAFFRGLSHSEIAAALSLPLGTVKSRIRDAMRSLRGRLGEGGGK